MEKTATKIADAIMPVIGKAFGTIAETIEASHAECEDKLRKINQELSERLAKQNSNIAEQRKEFDKKETTLKESIEQQNKQIEQLKKQLEQAKSSKSSAPIIPTIEPTSSSNSSAIKHMEFDTVLAMMRNRSTIGVAPYLVGPAGSGKTQMCEMIASEMAIDFYMTAKVDDKFGMEGYMDAHGKYNETPFYKAMKNGGVFMFDEMDASDNNAILCVNTALANGYYTFPNGEMVKAHENFYVIGAGNTFGTGADENYCGRVPLDPATLDRFAPVFIDYDERVELTCAKGNKDAVQFVHDVRNAIVKSRVSCSFTISYRGIKALVELEKMFGTKKAVQMAITKGLDIDNVSIIYNNLHMKENKYAKAFYNSATAYANAA